MSNVDSPFFEYLRISITDRCNLRCIYCMPPQGIKKIDHSKILTYEEILEIVNLCVSEGVYRVRITGGEPLVRKGVENFVSRLRQISEIKDISLTTNGILLSEKADLLAKSGLMRVNVSLDSLNPQRYREITRGGELKQVLNGIEKALEVGLTPVKINVVLIPGVNEDEILNFVNLARELPIHVRFIERMPFGNAQETNFVSQSNIISQIIGRCELIPENNTQSGGPASLFSLKEGKGKIGFISSRSNPFCQSCNRLRLSAEGHLIPCLDSGTGVMVRGKNKTELLEIIRSMGISKRNSQKKCASFVDASCRSLSSIGG
ncbi:MAG: GTP 3',8-cyclase MoaA [Candidatus Riflebacteria bacterium]|nr:GTP 3',8-cyclase MoaA [Candidatus Riflebacteria bacterium]